MAVCSCAGQFRGRAGFCEKPEDAVLIHGRDGCPQIGLAGEHHPHAVWRELFHLRQQLEPVHPWHLQVRDNHGERALTLDRRQRLLRAKRALDVKLVS